MRKLLDFRVCKFRKNFQHVTEHNHKNMNRRGCYSFSATLDGFYNKKVMTENRSILDKLRHCHFKKLYWLSIVSIKKNRILKL